MMKQHGIIEKSNAAYYSQVHLAPKGPDAWRFCVDYRNLNNCTAAGTGWPLPYIRQVYERIGQHKPTIFGVIDFKAGYHQIVLAQRCRPLLAFITAFGVFQPKTLPFGPKGAPSYVQMLMCTKVLFGLLFTICEVYLDDILHWGQDVDSYCKNLRTILKRIRDHELTLNPSKCKFGLSSVTYVGHTIDAEGVSIDMSKVAKILNFAKPRNQKELKSFLGLCNYVRDYIKGYAEFSRPLDKLLGTYERRKTLVWTPECGQAFSRLCDSINKSQKLFFYNSTAPVFLETDASAYCMGAILFQL
jgi:hypothetical protein